MKTNGALPIHSRAPSGRWPRLRLHELIQYRDLLLAMAVRNIRVRYKQSVLGAAWAVIQPALYLAAFSLMLSRHAGAPITGVPYSVFAFSGIVVWTFFANAVNAGAFSLLTSAALIRKLWFPRLLLPFAAIGPMLLDFLLANLALVALLVWMKQPFTLQLLWALPVMVLTLLAAISVGLLLSVLLLEFADLRTLLPIGLQLLMLSTSVVYPVQLVSAEWRWLLRFNPLTPIVQGYRDAVTGIPADLPGLLASAAFFGVLLLVALLVFRRREDRLADIA